MSKPPWNRCTRTRYDTGFTRCNAGGSASEGAVRVQRPGRLQHNVPLPPGTPEPSFVFSRPTPLILPPSSKRSEFRRWALTPEKMCSLASLLVRFAKRWLVTTKISSRNDGFWFLRAKCKQLTREFPGKSEQSAGRGREGGGVLKGEGGAREGRGGWRAAVVEGALG